VNADPVSAAGASELVCEAKSSRGGLLGPPRAIQKKRQTKKPVTLKRETGSPKNSLKSSDLVSIHRDAAAILRTFKLHLAVDQRIERMIVAHTDADARIELGAALSNEDVARLDHFAAVLLDSEALRVRIATVTG
jgi:hypothetical protein